MTAEYKVDGAIAVITLNNPPVNGLGLATAAAWSTACAGLADAAVKAIVITGAGKAFSGGADITEFGKEDAYREPHLISVIQQLDLSTKPVVAAIHSVCMGGGLELALGCHYRIAAPGTAWRCPRSSWACCPAPAARSACRACWAWKPR
jgi:3-hydroxyacyl-CoA dehydrogenase